LVAREPRVIYNPTFITTLAVGPGTAGIVGYAKITVQILTERTCSISNTADTENVFQRNGFGGIACSEACESTGGRITTRISAICVPIAIIIDFIDAKIHFGVL
jgi:hypothetical protein